MDISPITLRSSLRQDARPHPSCRRFSSPTSQISYQQFILMLLLVDTFYRHVQDVRRDNCHQWLPFNVMPRTSVDILPIAAFLCRA